MSFPYGLVTRLLVVPVIKAAAKAAKTARRGPLTSADRWPPRPGADGEAEAAAWQRFSAIVLAMNARNPDLAQRELLAVPRLTDTGKIKLVGYVIFCTRRRIRELAGPHPTQEDLSALVAAHVKDYRKVIRDDGAEFYQVLKTIMPGPEKMPANTLLVFGSGALGVLLPKGKAAGWLAAIRQDARDWAVRAEQNDRASGADLYRRDPQPDEQQHGESVTW
jgi:hypothetical protein